MGLRSERTMMGRREGGRGGGGGRRRSCSAVPAYSTVSGIFMPPLPLLRLASRSRCVFSRFFSMAALVPAG